ncbi:MAG: trehalose-phosphatase, partial [Planctomycetota bacterium]
MSLQAPTHTRLDAELEAKIDELSRLPVLLVGSDYDGTLSEIVTDPTKAHPHREAVIALRALAGLPRTHVAVISGRALADLAGLIGSSENMMLVGSHGSEFDLDFATSLDAAATRLRGEILEDLTAIANDFPGSAIEEKPASIALHYRNAAEGTEEEIVERVLAGAARRPGAVEKRGKMVFELAVVSTDKGHALSRIRHRFGASGALFLGDDVTDESAFATLAGPDLGIKVGDGSSRATMRV